MRALTGGEFPDREDQGADWTAAGAAGKPAGAEPPPAPRKPEARLPEPAEAEEEDEIEAGDAAEAATRRARPPRKASAGAAAAGAGQAPSEPGTAEPGAAQTEQNGAEQTSEVSDETQAGTEPDMDDTPTEMDIILAAELGFPAEFETPVGFFESWMPPELGEPKADEPVAAEPARSSRRPRRRRNQRGGAVPVAEGAVRRGAAEGEEASRSAGRAAPAQSELVYADIADIFEAAERAEEARRAKPSCVRRRNPSRNCPMCIVPEAALEPVSHVAVEPVEPPVSRKRPSLRRGAGNRSRKPAAPEPLVKPIADRRRLRLPRRKNAAGGGGRF